MDIKFEGLESILKSIDGIVDVDGLELAMDKACIVVENEAKRNASETKDTGNLSRSIKHKVEIDGTDIIGVVFSDVLYAPYREFGTGIFAEEGGRTDVPWNYQDDEGNWHSTSGMKPQPYLRPALQSKEKTVTKIIAKELSKNV